VSGFFLGGAREERGSGRHTSRVGEGEGGGEQGGPTRLPPRLGGPGSHFPPTISRIPPPPFLLRTLHLLLLPTPLDCRDSPHHPFFFVFFGGGEVPWSLMRFFFFVVGGGGGGWGSGFFLGGGGGPFVLFLPF